TPWLRAASRQAEDGPRHRRHERRAPKCRAVARESMAHAMHMPRGMTGLRSVLSALALLALGCGAAPQRAVQRATLAESAAIAAALAPIPAPAPLALVATVTPDGASGADLPVSAAPEPERFLDHDDLPILEALSTQEIVRVERGSGGRSLSFRATLADGTHAYFKPEQSF